MEDEPECDEDDTRDQELADGLPGRRSLEPLPCKQAQDHGAQRGDKAQGKVAAVVEHEWVFARKEVQEPHIEGLPKVAVLIPVGAKPGVEVMPIGGHANRGVVEIRAGSRIERPGQPISKKEGAERNPLVAGWPEGQQEEKGIAQADLRQRVFKSEVCLAAVERTKKDAQRDQQQRSPDGMAEHPGKWSALALAAPDGVGEGYANQEGEGGLDHVVQGTT